MTDTRTSEHEDAPDGANGQADEGSPLFEPEKLGDVRRLPCGCWGMMLADGNVRIDAEAFLCDQPHRQGQNITLADVASIAIAVAVDTHPHPEPSAVLIELPRAVAQSLYDHTGTMPFARGSWSNHVRSELAGALAADADVAVGTMVCVRCDGTVFGCECPEGFLSQDPEARP